MNTDLTLADPSWPSLINLVIAFIIPALTAYVSRWSDSKPTKAAITLLLSVITVVLTRVVANLTAGSPIVWRQLIVAAVATYIVACVVHYTGFKGSALQATLLGSGPRAAVSDTGRHSAAEGDGQWDGYKGLDEDLSASAEVVAPQHYTVDTGGFTDDDVQKLPGQDPDLEAVTSHNDGPHPSAEHDSQR